METKPKSNTYDYIFTMELLTKYINKTLRENELISSWAFSIDPLITTRMYVTIDYMHKLHSKTLLDLAYYSFEELVREFDYYLDKNIKEITHGNIES